MQPLIVNTPYTSIWSAYNNLTDGWPTHWTGTIKALCGAIRIDETPYIFMGQPGDCVTNSLMQQISVVVAPTQTYYTFQQDGVQLELIFSTPSFYAEYQNMALPFSYITYSVTSIDGLPHTVQIYYDNTAEASVTDVSELVEWSSTSLAYDGQAMGFGTVAQDYLGQTTDMIDWGYQYTAVTMNPGVNTTIAGSIAARAAFNSNQPLPPYDTNMPRNCSDNWPVQAIVYDLGVIEPGVAEMQYQVFAYDEVYSIYYFGAQYQPYWRHVFANNSIAMLEYALANYASLRAQCSAFDTELIANLTAIGGDTYATVASLAFRQATGANAIVWNQDRELVWAFMKEISSDGDVSTVDVVFPASPIFNLFAPETLRLILLPILAYANNETNIPYNLPWSPHQLGTWPICDITPGEQEQMPMEETGNMLIMLATIAQQQDGDVLYLEPYRPLLDMWANFLNITLPYPGNQLCTDDFEGPSPNNSNLAAKGVVGLGAYSLLLTQFHDERADQFMGYAQEFMQDWLVLANDTNHYRRQYNLTASWSLKYNIFYQYVLGLDLFPSTVMQLEEAYYASNQTNPYGVPLDDRATFTKTDWLSWIAAMGSDEQFDALFGAIFRFANETPNRVPFSDWYDTISGDQVGFCARPVIGGLYAKMLLESLSSD